MRVLFALALMTGFTWSVSPVWATDCPDPMDHSAELNSLIASARAAPSEMDGRVFSGQMWEVWLRAPNEQAQAILNRGMERRDGFDYAGAYAEFDALTKYCPTYAEGFNQRAYVQFLQGAFDGALNDLDAALALSPNHVAAQSGRALTLLQLRRTDEARAQMLEALENNPWLAERALVADGAPLGLKGEDI